MGTSTKARQHLRQLRQNKREDALKKYDETLVSHVNFVIFGRKYEGFENDLKPEAVVSELGLMPMHRNSAAS